MRPQPTPTTRRRRERRVSGGPRSRRPATAAGFRLSFVALLFFAPRQHAGRLDLGWAAHGGPFAAYSSRRGRRHRVLGGRVQARLYRRIELLHLGAHSLGLGHILKLSLSVHRRPARPAALLAL